jgi:hypothetical protein
MRINDNEQIPQDFLTSEQKNGILQILTPVICRLYNVAHRYQPFHIYFFAALEINPAKQNALIIITPVRICLY